MKRNDIMRQRALRWGLAWLFWTFIGLSFATQFYLSSFKAGQPISWGQAVSWSLGDWYVWALIALPIMGLARRFRFDGPRWGRGVVIHLLASAVFSLCYMVVRALVGQLQSGLSGSPITFAEALSPLRTKTFHFNLLIYWLIVSATHAVAYYREFQERAVRASELEKRLAQARLQALQMQLNPHFLFNTLHAISALMHKDVAAADRMITRLSDLLRYALESTSSQEVPLRQELEFLERYLEIERTRFGSRLSVNIECAPETREALVPNLVLQPLVENAIRHGIEPRAKPGRIEIRSWREEAMVRLEVRDNGGGLKSDGALKEGIGLSNTRARLRQLYGDAQSLKLEGGEEGGLAVSVSLPYRVRQSEASRGDGPE